MTHQALNHDQQLGMLTPIHQQVKDVCRSVGIDVEAAERVAKDNDLQLPWHDEASPQACLERTKQILRASLPDHATANEFQDHFVDGGGPGQRPVGLIGAIAVADNEMWPGPAKAAFIADYPLSPYAMFLDPCPTNEPDKTTGAAFQGTLCWLVHDLLAVAALEQTSLSDASRQVLDILSDNLAEVMKQDINLSESLGANESFSSGRKTELVLMLLAQKKPELKRMVSAMLQKLKEYGESEMGAGGMLLDALQVRLYPDPVDFANLSGFTIAVEAMKQNLNFAALHGIANTLYETLTSNPEWEQPLQAAAREIESKQISYLTFSDSDVLTTKAKEVLLDILRQAPNTRLEISVDRLFTRSADDPTYSQIAAELNDFIATDIQGRFTSRTSQPNFDARKAQVIDFLSALSQVISSRNLNLTFPEELVKIEPPPGKSTCIIGKPPEPRATGDVGLISIALKRVEADSERVSRLRQAITDASEASGVVFGCVAGLIKHAVVPIVADRADQRDQHGLNGYRMDSLLEHLYGLKIEGVGVLPTESGRYFYDQGALVIRYTGKDEDLPEEQPIDEEELGTDEPDLDLDTETISVGSRNKIHSS